MLSQVVEIQIFHLLKFKTHYKIDLVYEICPLYFDHIYASTKIYLRMSCLKNI